MIEGTLSDQEENDLLSLMIRARDDETNIGFTDQLIKDNCYAFFIAGHETTATALPGVLLFLAQVFIGTVFISLNIATFIVSNYIIY